MSIWNLNPKAETFTVHVPEMCGLHKALELCVDTVKQKKKKKLANQPYGITARCRLVSFTRTTFVYEMWLVREKQESPNA